MFSAKKKTFRFVSLVFAVFLCLGLLAPAAQAHASPYLHCYAATILPDGNGKVGVWYDVTGTGTMEEIGSLSISLYENGKLVKSYSYVTTPSMMAYNTHFHAGGVSYYGVAGRSYYAIVYFWAAKLGDGDTRSMTTTTIIAT